MTNKIKGLFLAALLLPAVLLAQQPVGPRVVGPLLDGGGGGAGSSTITSGTTVTSGCLDGAPLKSSSNTVVCTKMDLTKYMTADQSDVTGAFVDVTDLGFTVAANTVYAFSCSFVVTSSGTTFGVQIAFNGPASPTALNYAGAGSGSAATVTSPSGTAYNSTTGLPINALATASLLSYGGTLENGANAGTFIPRLRTEVATNTATILRGSWCRVWTP